MVKVLVVDDDPAVVEGLTKILQRDNYQVKGVVSGEQAMEKIKEGFDIVITDLVMPGVSGMDILRQAKRDSPKSAVIMITGFATVENAVDTMKHGARDYITKPFDPKALRDVVKDVVEELEFEDRKKKKAREYPLKDHDVDKIIKALSNPIRRRSVGYLREKGKSSFTDIWRFLKVDDPTKLSFHLRVLKQADLICQDETKVYSLTEQGKKAIDLIDRF